MGDQQGGTDGVAWLANYRATIEKERYAQDRWWTEWGFLAESAAEGVLPNNRNEFVKALEAKYQKMAEGKPFPGFSRESSKWGTTTLNGEVLEKPSNHRMRKMKHIVPTDPY